ncbi:MAG TPA: peptide deformylase [Candidatus Paceibacterota bacterium]
MSAKILQKDDPRLRIVSRAIAKSEIGGTYLADLIERLHETLKKESDGVAIAAPQLGENVRLFVIASKDPLKPKEVIKCIFINPIIVKTSVKKEFLEEGCLSVRNIYGRIRRSTKVTIEALDENGKKFSRGAVGLLAEIFQHEIDHLDGILFIDKAKDLKEILVHE